MAVLVDRIPRLFVQGFAGKRGTFHSEPAISYGTKMVGALRQMRETPSIFACFDTSLMQCR